jgi:uncharacterized phage protein (TIGR01671 family)
MKIKFRGWDIKRKEMFFVDTMVFRLNNDVYRVWKNVVEPEGGLLINPITGILMQYIGLRDNNGVEIYEGDIVAKFDFQDPYFRSAVVRHLGAFGYKDSGDFIVFAANYHFNWVNGKSEKIAVIGNIYENYELIKVKGQTKEK